MLVKRNEMENVSKILEGSIVDSLGLAFPWAGNVENFNRIVGLGFADPLDDAWHRVDLVGVADAVRFFRLAQQLDGELGAGGEDAAGANDQGCVAVADVEARALCGTARGCFFEAATESCAREVLFPELAIFGHSSFGTPSSPGECGLQSGAVKGGAIDPGLAAGYDFSEHCRDVGMFG